MPDWSYHPLFKPWLSKLPGSTGREFIHRGMSMISSIPGGSHFIDFLGHMAPSSQLEKKLFGLTISNPVGLSGKVDPLLTGTNAFFHLGFGFVEVGPVRDTPIMERPATIRQNQILYPVPTESIGIEKTIKKLEQLRPYKKPIFIRLDSSQSFKHLFSQMSSLSPYGDAFILEGILKKNELQHIKEQLHQPILRSVNQNQLKKEIATIHYMYNHGLIDGIVIEENFVKDDKWQFSQSNQTPELVQSLKLLRENHLSHMPTIISGGIREPQDAMMLFEHGADLVMLSSGYILSGPGLPKRINEALLDHDETKQEYAGWKWYWLFGLFIFLGGLLALTFSITSVILPYDESFLGLTREQLLAVNPRIIYFMAHDRMTLAGTMISGGIVYMQLARHGVKYGIHWAKKAIDIAGIIGFLGILLFIGYGYFDWLHALFWIVLAPVFYLGWKKTRNIREVSSSKNRRNHGFWKRAIWGQLAFVVLGFSFVIGGIVIAAIGITSVFVSTDILYICMSPEQLNALTEKLIPVIAHDRAGFGGALISVGLLVLTLSLWGFHQGERWVWYTLFIGGIPAFSAGLLTHFLIGYTIFIHLLPAYFALFLYLIGLVLSKGFFFERNRK